MDEWIFTFGYGHALQGYYVRVKGSYSEARRKMIEKFGLHWAFQYSAEDWERWKQDPNKWRWLTEQEIRIEGLS